VLPRQHGVCLPDNTDGRQEIGPLETAFEKVAPLAWRGVNIHANHNEKHHPQRHGNRKSAEPFLASFRVRTFIVDQAVIALGSCQLTEGDHLGVV
jgi:hypothetical protein